MSVIQLYTIRLFHTLFYAHCLVSGDALFPRRQKEQISYASFVCFYKNILNHTKLINSLTSVKTSFGFSQIYKSCCGVVLELKRCRSNWYFKHHLHRKMRRVPSPTCPCGEVEKPTEHILQECRNLRSLREELWPRPVPLQDKLHGPVETLQKTTSIISRAGLQVWHWQTKKRKLTL